MGVEEKNLFLCHNLLEDEGGGCTGQARVHEEKEKKERRSSCGVGTRRGTGKKNRPKEEEEIITQIGWDRGKGKLGVRDEESPPGFGQPRRVAFRGCWEKGLEHLKEQPNLL